MYSKLVNRGSPAGMRNPPPAEDSSRCFTPRPYGYADLAAMAVALATTMTIGTPWV
jgi:hypothetical protein